MSISASPPPHVAVLAFPYGTHAAPLLSLIRHLANLSPQTHFSFLSTAASNSTHFSAAKSLPNLTRRDIPEPSIDDEHHSAVMVKFLSTAEEVFSKEVKEVEIEVGKKVTCLVTDAFYGFVAEMASAMSVGWIAFWTAGPASLSAHFHTDLIRDKIGIKGEAEVKKSETLDFIPGMSKIRVEDIPPEIFGDLESTFNKTLHQMARELPRATSVFINSFESLDPTITADLDSKFQRFLNVGPISLISDQPAGSSDLHECLPWLDTQAAKSVAYISFGTVTAPPPHELYAIAEALEESHTPFLWSLKDHSRTHLPDGFLDRTRNLGKIVPWAPQVEVLAHPSVGVFVSHCGWNSVLECLISGVPMICRPFFGDQKLNARLITNLLEIGRVVDRGIVTKNGLMESLEVILTGESGSRMRERAEELKRGAREAVKEDGSSVKDLRILLDQVNQV